MNMTKISSIQGNIDSSFSQISVVESTLSISDDSDELTRGPLELKRFLANWVDTFNIPASSSNGLLKGLKLLKYQQNVFDGLPSDAWTLLQTPSRIQVDSIAGGTYKHFGIKTGIVKYLQQYHQRNIPSYLSIFVIVGGLPLAKIILSVFWPILGLITGTETPFPIGVYKWESKTKNEFLQQFIEEAIHLTANGIFFREIRVKFSLSGFVCYAPARTFITGTSGHGAKSGCPRCTTIGYRWYAGRGLYFLENPERLLLHVQWC